MNGHLNIVGFLVNEGASINEKSSGKDSALHLAAKRGHLTIVNYLIKNRARINLKNQCF